MGKGRVVITGAGRGIGKSLAAEFAARGHPLLIAAEVAAEIESSALELAQRYAVEVQALVVDLTTLEGRATLVDRARELGPIGGLVNNAGFGVAGPFAELDRQREISMIRLNSEAVVDLCHGVVPLLQGPGAFVINTASTAAFQPVPLFATYAASKAFVLSFSQSLGNELQGAGIHVMALCPGFTATGFQKAADLGLQQMARAPGPDEVARFAVRSLDRRKRVAVHGARNKLLVFFQRFVPRGLVAAVARREIEPWFNHRALKDRAP